MKENAALENIGAVDEIVWITTLSEQEIRERLEAPVVIEQLKGVRRLRVMNLNNPLYDLGHNVFYHYPNLDMVGAFTHILDFETVYRVIQQSLRQDLNKELDEEILGIVALLKKELRTKPAEPLDLRVARYLDDLKFSWEELRPIHTDWSVNKSYIR